MTKAELIAYLDAVVDAESAAEACELALRRCRKEMDLLCPPAALPPPAALTSPQQPKPPERDRLSAEDIEEKLRSPFFLGAFIFIAILCAVLTFLQLGYTLSYKYPDLAQSLAWHESLIALILAFAIPIVIGAIASFIICAVFLLILFYIHDCREDKRYQAALDEHNKRYKAAVESHNKQHQQYLDDYAKQKENHHQLCSLINRSREVLQRREQLLLQKRSEIQNRLYALYHFRDIIYPSFRNIVAVSTIREYLRMGICSELEGANGAYAQYMKDVRIGILRDSIDALRNAVVSSIAQLQRTLVSELNQINNSIVTVGEDISCTLREAERSLGQSFALSVQQSTEQTHTLLNQANNQTHTLLNRATEKLARIQSNTDIIAINQYIANRMAGVDAYLA